MYQDTNLVRPTSQQTGMDPQSTRPRPRRTVTTRSRRRPTRNPEWIDPTTTITDLGVTTSASFVTPWEAVVQISPVLLSSRYHHSYIHQDTLDALGFQPGPCFVAPSSNPRGRPFNPIGISSIWVRVGRSEPTLIDAHVLPGLASEMGVLFICGAPDLARIFGPTWTPQQHVESRP